ncbi:zinc-binding protein A33-like [Scomber japonicus]|uniref:zinc-binding protein A33-like n=1 Tax=Scomber japonicus TaxID=13676 RepID=UPI0023050EDB|nr:zinc-binding protein A33-like [Scomber japonicus]
MAERALLERFLRCPLCSVTFRDPVSLSCTHNFCSSCLQTSWEKTEDKNCPICKRKSSKDPEVDFSLKEGADSFARRQKAGSSETEKEENEVDSPVEQTISDVKDQKESDLKSLQHEMDKCQQMVDIIKDQRSSTEKQIRAEFKKLHQFLKEEEESRLAALREEGEQKGKTMSREMKRIEEQISSLYKPTQTRARDQCSLSDPQLVSGALIDEAKHLGNLSFRVWEKMKEKVHFSPVILDPNTAHPRLHLSDDLTSVRKGDTKKQLPDNPERHINYCNVLGSEGFSSGKHSWEVEVGDHPGWFVGLAKESADRKRQCSASPDSGIWCLEYRRGKYTDGSGKTVSKKKSLQKIRVKLNYERGEVSFYNPEDKTHIYTHRDTFTEKLFPYFSIEDSHDAENIDIKICQTET